MSTKTLVKWFVPGCSGSKFSNFVSTPNGRYLFCLQSDFVYDSVKNIGVIDMKLQTFSWSTVKCKIPQYFKCVLMVNKHSDDLLMTGFVNQSYKEQQFQNVQPIPVQVIGLMRKWWCRDFIHVVEGHEFLLPAKMYSSDGRHFKIAVDDVLQSAV